MPKAAPKAQNSAETVAPDQPGSELVLRKLQDMLKDDQATSKLEKETGMSREEMEQFVKKFTKAPKAEPTDGRKIEIKPGEVRPSAPDTAQPPLSPGARFSTQSLRDKGAVVQDQARDNIEANRFAPPREVLPGFEAYTKTLSRAKTPAPVRSGAGAR